MHKLHISEEEKQKMTEIFKEYTTKMSMEEKLIVLSRYVDKEIEARQKDVMEATLKKEPCLVEAGAAVQIKGVKQMLIELGLYREND